MTDPSLNFPEKKGKSILLMTTAPPSNAPWVLGRKLPPLGLAYVAGALEKDGYNVQILDNYLIKKPINEVKQTIAQLETEIVGITCGSATYQRCLETARAVKEARPSCKVVVGGWHASYAPDSLLKQPEIDYVVIGEGEQAMSDLAAHITKGGKYEDVGEIAGVGYRHNGNMIKNPPRVIENLDQVPFPARHLLPMKKMSSI
jgi:anaerobic magnesium-protoporphyrin IX monomethyl ester cyclase